MIYCEGIESRLRDENTRLTKELEDAQLDLEDARRSRRDMQQQLNMASARVGQFSADCDSMRVFLPLPFSWIGIGRMLMNTRISTLILYY